MKPNQNWSDKKPTEPGEYAVRWSEKHDPIRAVDQERVTVTRKGRGLSVYSSRYNDQIPMSQMADMLEWRKIE